MVDQSSEARIGLNPELPIVQPSPAVQRRCGYCDENVHITAPYVSPSQGHFLAQCQHCRKVTKYFFINGRVTSQEPVWKFRQFEDMSTSKGVRPEIANLAQEACECAYIAFYRGAAVTLRASAELLALGELLDENLDKAKLLRLTPAIKLIRRGGTRGLLPSLEQYKRNQIAKDLEWIRDLGDSAAHPRIRPKSRYVPTIRSKVYDGMRKLENIVSLSFGG